MITGNRALSVALLAAYPLRVECGEVVTLQGQAILKANREHGTTPLAPVVRDDGDLQLLATLNDKDGYLSEKSFLRLAEMIKDQLQALIDCAREPKTKIIILERDDAPDYVPLEPPERPTIDTDESRAARAARALGHVYDDETEANIIDLLTDLRHFCGQQNIDFNAALEMSEIHAEAEGVKP